MARILDGRLHHLLKLRKQAERDVQNYVKNRWPVGSKVSWVSHGVSYTGVVYRHFPATIFVTCDGAKFRVPYERIKQKRGSL